MQRNHAPIRPKSLDTRRCDSESLSVALGNITNMLGIVIERLDKTESKLESMERKINSPLSSSATSGAEAKRKIPTIVRVSVFPCILVLYINMLIHMHFYVLFCRQRPGKFTRPCLMVMSSLDLIFLLSKNIFCFFWLELVHIVTFLELTTRTV